MGQLNKLDMYKLKPNCVSARARSAFHLQIPLQLSQVKFSQCERNKKKNRQKEIKPKSETKPETKRAKTNHKRQPQLHAQAGIQCKLCSKVAEEMPFMAVISCSCSRSSSFCFCLSFFVCGCDRRIAGLSARQLSNARRSDSPRTNGIVR